MGKKKWEEWKEKKKKRRLTTKGAPSWLCISVYVPFWGERKVPLDPKKKKKKKKRSVEEEEEEEEGAFLAALVVRLVVVAVWVATVTYFSG